MNLMTVCKVKAELIDMGAVWVCAFNCAVYTILLLSYLDRYKIQNNGNLRAKDPFEKDLWS